MSHVDEGTLHAYLDGELSPVEREGVEIHLAECGACRMRLDEARALIERAQALLGRAAPPETAVPPVRRHGGGPIGRPLPRWVPMAWAATVLLALGGGWLARGGGGSGGVTLAPPDQPASEVAASRDAAPAPATPANRDAPGETDVAALPTDDRLSTKPEARALGDVTVAAVAPAPADTPRRSEAEGAASAGAAAPAAFAARELTTATLDHDAARARLGADLYGIAGVPVLMIRPAANGAIVVEQQIDTGVVVRLIERRAGLDEAGRAAARAAPERARQDAAERLARFVGALRVEIEGPLTVDSLSRLLDRLRPIK